MKFKVDGFKVSKMIFYIYFKFGKLNLNVYMYMLGSIMFEVCLFDLIWRVNYLDLKYVLVINILVCLLCIYRIWL